MIQNIPTKIKIIMSQDYVKKSKEIRNSVEDDDDE